MVSVTDSMQVTKETSRMCEQCVPPIFRAPGNEARQKCEKLFYFEILGRWCTPPCGIQLRGAINVKWREGQEWSISLSENPM